MTRAEKYDTMLTGIVSGFISPIIVGLIIYLFTAHGKSLPQYLKTIADANIITHTITLCVFSNILIFLLFNRFDMLRALRGVLAITIVWAITVFVIRFI